MEDSEDDCFPEPEDVTVCVPEELKQLLPDPAQRLPPPPPPLRRLRVLEVLYSGATLAEVLIGRRVLCLSVAPPADAAAEPLQPRGTVDDLLVTRLELIMPISERRTLPALSRSPSPR
jgi:hypothetical protein